MDAQLFLKSQLWLQISASDAWPPDGAPNLTLESSLASFALKPAPGAPLRDDWLLLRSLGRKRRRDDASVTQNEASDSITLELEVAITADQESCKRLYFRIDRTVFFVDHTLIESIACPVPAAEGVSDPARAPNLSTVLQCQVFGRHSVLTCIVLAAYTGSRDDSSTSGDSGFPKRDHALAATGKNMLSLYCKSTLQRHAKHEHIIQCC
jgi:hypothetical protein